MRRFAIMFAALALLTVSCSKEEWTPQHNETTSRLLNIYNSAALLTACEFDGTRLVARFTGDVSVEVDNGLTPVFSIIEGNNPDVKLNSRGEWTINGSKTGIWNTEGLANIESVAVCVAFDFETLYIYMSNGNVLHIPSDEKHSLWGFSFRKTENSFLTENVECSIKGNKITGVVPPGVLFRNLYPSVEFRGKAISVNSMPQRNRRDCQNFSAPVEYELTLFDGKKIKYTVNISEPYPTVWITTEGQKEVTSRSTYIPATIKISDPAHVYWTIDEFETKMQIRGRGNSTWGMPKQPYKIKLDEKAPVFGMRSDKDWCLMANYADKTLLRNTLGQEVSRVCGMQWVPETRNVDLYMNGRYVGSYDFTEHKEVSSHRVDIDLDAGDCYLEIEAKKDNPVWFDTQMGITIMFSDPEQPSSQQLVEIRSFITNFEKVLKSGYSDDPDIGYAAYIDVDSFVNNFIIQELAKNIDADLFKSLFLVKRKGGKLEFYHQWDFDLAFGNCNYLNAHAQVSNGPEGWYIKNHSQAGINTGWYYYLFKDPAFVAGVKSRWNEVYPQLKMLNNVIEKKYQEVAGSAGRNFERWKILDKYVWPNQVWLGDYRKEVDYMQKYYDDRLEWMNTEINKW